MILVTGATGTVGSRVLRRLVDAGAKVRALTRNPARAALPAGVDVVSGDMAVPDTLVPALDGVERVFLMSAGHHKAEYDANLVSVARTTAVRHVVQLSSMGGEEFAQDGVDNELARWHREAEEALRESGMAWTILRPGEFMSNALGWAHSIRAEGVVRSPAPDLVQAPIDPDDIAAVAVAALTTPGHDGRIHTLTGPEALSARDQVAVLASALGRDIRVERISLDEQRAAMARHHPPETVAGVLQALGQAIALDRPRARPLPTVAEVLGRPARTFREWVEAHVDAFA
ncbi:Uncharacterized conserved protein YbjT, contains NAD(P)-binding and DUF2867 domains [Streptoalloteichus tenebrarius]|uniref:Uncharacterized conserved protein YbjT, contains NAD(P)-binding and DUF2867 domains n=1 Tax=Streptoalloteichus tenebrarius (strain ATCC 17920 / DSM 40477 / JCM 4838 / CBS 697.72 / NBRC 16177 / NCIMB 11028 / NRRL B-12390 / A12253. 1 / ISP 5477) TaxID=1933 RepID=A0ABT1HXM3_STRSD|nr:NAD(P)H-binding protein [Streptoalloteichus tenebrarius]MCP2260260.1 Uncharacterized conserved protein YbjT, contains NAD(P)-binding and DUF2867 domains [Streptoalloteichus tenebrarius]BFF03009.1 NAD(P)H-binding protein [Streptoalloteichus tenebrarius]